MIWKSMLTLCLYLALSHGLTRQEKNKFTTTPWSEDRNTSLPDPSLTITSSGKYWVITSNNIPGHATGPFPGRGNPNYIQEQEFEFSVPKNPEVAAESVCLPPGPIGIAVNGIVMYNPWDADNENAVEGEGSEVFDSCDGHPDANGRYHYHHQNSTCLFNKPLNSTSELVGVAFDGFPIYGPLLDNGTVLTASNLDDCNGREIEGNAGYQYHLTVDFPYIMGCYKGTPEGVATGGSRCFKASEADSSGNVGGAQ